LCGAGEPPGRSSGTLTSATQLVARASLESVDSPPGLAMADALELGLSMVEVQAVACANDLAAPHPSLQTLTPDNIFFTADGCSVRIPFLTPLSLPCVPPKTVLRLRTVAAQSAPMAHSATRSPSTRYTSPEVVASTPLDRTAAYGHTQAFVAPVATAVQSLDAEKASAFTVGAVLQFCATGQAPKSAEELLRSSLSVTITMPLQHTSSAHDATTTQLCAVAGVSMCMASGLMRATDPVMHARPSLQELQSLLLEELYSLKRAPLKAVAEWETEEKTTESVGGGGMGSSMRSSHVHMSVDLPEQAWAAAGQGDSLKSGNESSSQLSSGRLRPAWNRESPRARNRVACLSGAPPKVFVPP
jgi:hypothetical protein